MECASANRRVEKHIRPLHPRSPVLRRLGIAHGAARSPGMFLSLARVKLLILDDWGDRRR